MYLTAELSVWLTSSAKLAFQGTYIERWNYRADPFKKMDVKLLQQYIANTNQKCIFIKNKTNIKQGEKKTELNSNYLKGRQECVDIIKFSFTYLLFIL